MFFDWEGFEFYVKPGFVDMRSGRVRLMEIVMNRMKEDVFSKKAFLFCGKNHRLIKVLVWDTNGFWVMAKYLESGTFSWPKDPEEALRINEDDVRRLLSGQDVFRRLPELEKGLLV